MLANPEKSRPRPKNGLPTWAIATLYSSLAIPAVILGLDYFQTKNKPLPHHLLCVSAFQNPESATDPNAPFIRLEALCLAQQPELGKFINPQINLSIEVTQLDTSKNLTRTLVLRDLKTGTHQTLISQPGNLPDLSAVTQNGSINNQPIRAQNQYELYVFRKSTTKPVDSRILSSNKVEARLAFDAPSCPPE